MTKSVKDMTNEEFATYKEEWLEKNHTHYSKWYKCKDCGTLCETHGRKTQEESEKDLLENYKCLNCGSANIEGDNIVQKFRNAVDLCRGGPAVGIYDYF